MNKALHCRPKWGFGHEPGCVLALPFRHLDGDSFMDRSVYGHLCTNHGSRWQLDGRYFDGVDNTRIQIPHHSSLDLIADFTIEHRVNPRILKDNAKSLCHGLWNNFGIYSHLDAGNAILALVVDRSGASPNFAPASNTLIAGFPNDITYVNRLGTGQSYIKGNPSAGPDTVGYAASTTKPFYIGCYDDLTMVWDGLIVDFYAYNFADYAPRILSRSIGG